MNTDNGRQKGKQLARGAAVYGAALLGLILNAPAQAALNETCVVSVLNRTVQVKAGRAQPVRSVVPWAQVLTIEKVSFPLNSRGLRVGVDCDCFNGAVSEIGNVVKEQGRCFIYTIPQLRNRDKVIKDLESIRCSERG